MKKLLTLVVAMMVSLSAWAQSSRVISAEQANQSPLGPVDRNVNEALVPASNATQAGSGLPIGTITTDAVTAIKVGEASNAYTFVVPNNNQLATAASTGGGSVAFIYRQNVTGCGGQTIDNGLFRMSISSDGGNNWDVGSAGTSSSGGTPVGCYGIGPINPGYSQVSRYPNIAISLTGGGTAPSDLIAVYSGPVLDPGYPTVEGWDGVVAGVVDDPSGTASTTQESYYFQNNNQFQSYSLVERVSGEYWYVAWSYDSNLPDALQVGSTLFLNKGTYDENTGQVNWSAVKSYNLPFQKSVTATGDSVPIRVTPNIAFSPDGTTGFVSLQGDINDRDTVYQPILIESTDGGQTWGNPVEVDLSQFAELREALQSFWIVTDTTTGDTLPFGSGKPTTGFDHDLVVDKNGNPHMLVVVGNASTNTANGGTNEAAYSIVSAARMFMVDITRDNFGDFSGILLGPQVTFRGTFGTGSGDSDQTTADPWVQMSRSADGSKVFFSWTDSDTTGGNFGNSDNSNPNLIGAALDVDNMKITNLTNWTITDNTWVSRAVMPKVAPVALDKANNEHAVPTVIMDIGTGSSLLDPVSFWYFSDVTYAPADYVNDAEFFYNCKENPFSNNVMPTEPGCGLSDGVLQVMASGGLGGYTYQWDAAAGGATTATVSGLAAGIYKVTVTDSVGCSETIEVTLNNASAPVLTQDSVANISCFGAGDGYAAVSVTTPSGAAIASYAWSNGETDSVATMLPAGTNTLTVTDVNNCVSLTTVTIAEPDELTVSVSGTDPLCFGDANGQVSAISAGGTGTVSFAWDNGGTDPTLSGLPDGSYTVTVTDENGCNANETVTISQPDTLALSLSSIANNNQNPPFGGIAIVSATGGTDPVSYTWTGPDGYQDNSNQTTIFGLNGGTYVVTATDANGCVTIDSVVVDGRVDISDAIEDELAAGISNMKLYPNPNNGVFTVDLEMDRAENVTVSILNLNGQVVDMVSARSAISFRHNFQLQTLPAGIYLVQVTTERGTAGRRVVLR